MIYKFKSKAAGDVIMMGPSGDHVLRIMGKQPGPTGIIEPSDMPAAIKAIEQAIHDEEEQRKQDEADAAAAGKTLPPRESVTLRQRAWPLVDMLRRSLAADKEVVWGV